MNIDNPKNVIRIERDELALNYKYREGGEFLNNIDICSYEYEFPELNRRYDFHPIESFWRECLLKNRIFL